MVGTDAYEPRRIRRRNVRLDPLDYGNAEQAVLTAREAFRTKGFM